MPQRPGSSSSSVAPQQRRAPRQSQETTHPDRFYLSSPGCSQRGNWPPVLRVQEANPQTWGLPIGGKCVQREVVGR
eukprot:2128357-Pyramimonas_sp.AAC.1